jgi:TPR repeat protein
MGNTYLYGTGGVAKNTAEATKWFHKLSESGQADGDFGMGLIFFEEGKQEAAKYQEAAKWIRRAAEKNHAHAQNYLAVMYANGLGLERDQTKAIAWFRKAAEQNEVAAEYSLGHIHELGLGVPVDRKTALAWYRKSASHGYQPAANKVRMLESQPQ